LVVIDPADNRQVSELAKQKANLAYMIGLEAIGVAITVLLAVAVSAWFVLVGGLALLCVGIGIQQTREKIKKLS
jgi:hypothetical protein